MFRTKINVFKKAFTKNDFNERFCISWSRLTTQSCYVLRVGKFNFWVIVDETDVNDIFVVDRCEVTEAWNTDETKFWLRIVTNRGQLLGTFYNWTSVNDRSVEYATHRKNFADEEEIHCQVIFRSDEFASTGHLQFFLFFFFWTTTTVLFGFKRDHAHRKYRSFRAFLTNTTFWFSTWRIFIPNPTYSNLYLLLLYFIFLVTRVYSKFCKNAFRFLGLMTFDKSFQTRNNNQEWYANTYVTFKITRFWFKAIKFHYTLI